MTMDVAAAGQGYCSQFFNTVSEYSSRSYDKVSSGASYVWNTTADFAKDVYDKVLPYLGRLGDWFKENADLVWTFSSGAAAGAGVALIGFLSYYFCCKGGEETATTTTATNTTTTTDPETTTATV